MQLKDYNILIGVTGGIAAYKIPLLIRLLRKANANVKVIATEAALDFVTPLTLSTLSENPVYINPFDRQTGEWNSHVELANWAHLFLIAPTTANTLAKMASGQADNLLMTTYLAAKCPIFFAPAMDLDMYKHPATQRNIHIIRTYGHKLIEPTSGELASGLCGEGRMEEPDKIFQIITEYFTPTKSFAGKKVLISAGPTYEAIDSVRFIGNHSSGQMGFAIAEEFRKRKANVILISGPVRAVESSEGIKRYNVISAAQMHDAVIQESYNADIVIMAAAVADYTPVSALPGKIKKKDQPISITLQPTKDILAELGRTKKKHQLLVGFALEAEDESNNAKSKLKNKNADIIVLNSLNDEGAGFGFETNKITIFDCHGNAQEFGLKSKNQVAVDLADYIWNFTNYKD
ncbi:MAG TPA: bifunctional phosphopantothenoylcysteine decarboxylase/phosphopantothenate--cysteine ligase CoaBC [Bacteroidales bacterium]|nr:bifunctional phosphopantothenoylcysteine decarboxylase/phosphopantothenate--cysteine ligase CoaBC [Bacteroidales bacterium]